MLSTPNRKSPREGTAVAVEILTSTVPSSSLSSSLSLEVTTAALGTKTSGSNTTCLDTNNNYNVWFVQQLPMELQVRILANLRANELSSIHQLNQYFYYNRKLQHDIVIYCSEQVYPKQLTSGFELQPVYCSNYMNNNNNNIQNSSNTKTTTTANAISKSNNKSTNRKNRSSSVGSYTNDKIIKVDNNDEMNASTHLTENDTTNMVSPSSSNNNNNLNYYTFEHLRNMELLVVARVLNSPEPTTGYVVSKCMYIIMYQLMCYKCIRFISFF